MPTAQTCVITPTTLPNYQEMGNVLKVSFRWTSTDAGVVVGAVTPYKIRGGPLLWFDAIPDPTTTTPTAGYLFTVKNESGADILGGLGVGSSTATAAVHKGFSDGLGGCKDSTLTFAGSGMGDAKGGLLDLYFPA